MSSACPNGHDSEWPDWCSVCGERIGAAVEAPDGGGAPAPGVTPATAAPAAQPAVAPTPIGPTCDNCGVPRHEHDVFCESCGYDFASGSLPEVSPDEQAEAALASHAVPMHAKVSVDAAFFSASVGDADLSLPIPLPGQQMVPLTGTRILIGRKSVSRGVFPELDVQALTDDPAVSTQHAVIERDGDGIWTLTDLGSTNGTYLSPDAMDPIEAGTAVPADAGSTFYVGAWTRIDLAETSG